MLLLVFVCFIQISELLTVMCWLGEGTTAYVHIHPFLSSILSFCLFPSPSPCSLISRFFVFSFFLRRNDCVCSCPCSSFPLVFSSLLSSSFSSLFSPASLLLACLLTCVLLWRWCVGEGKGWLRMFMSMFVLPLHSSIPFFLSFPPLLASDHSFLISSAGEE